MSSESEIVAVAELLNGIILDVASKRYGEKDGAVGRFRNGGRDCLDLCDIDILEVARRAYLAGQEVHPGCITI